MSSAPGRSATPGNGVGGANVRGCGTAVSALLCSKDIDIQCTGGCIGVDPGGSCPLLHYLDDFLLVGGVGSEECTVSLRVTQEVCRQLGVPLAMYKLEGPVCCLTFLGITIDTEAMELRLPADKLARLRSMIQQWGARKSCSKWELLSLIGHLQHACRVVKPGRVFLRHMIDLASVAKELHHFVRLNKDSGQISSGGHCSFASGKESAYCRRSCNNHRR